MGKGWHRNRNKPYLAAGLILGLLTACAPAPQQNEDDGLHVPSPDWRDQIIYFVLTDRFNDGNPANNDQGMGEYDPSTESHFNGGDIPGITEKLDYIQQLGATALWLTPPVANQWWSTDSDYSGYHGYWARDFTKVDEHYGTLQDYIDLSKALHQRDMYLIQDIVVNHTGIYFGYDGDYNPDNSAENFTLYETGPQAAPDMAPFDQVNRLNPEHARAAIYNWTPPANNYADLEQQFTYQLGNLSDINTKNPAVIAAFKAAYKYWMETVGVDAFRIDTVKYVEHSFWRQFLHDEDGIFAHAKSLGKAHFLAFGEVFNSSPPFSDEGEKKVISFLGSQQQPELNSVIGFPLYFELNNVLGEGKPTAQLAYRLERFMALYPDPYVVPNFIDNHDTKRFLAGASVAALKQALATLFTIPGIPVIYQGTEQGLVETRQAMFAGGYLAEQDAFDVDSELYHYLRSLAQLRSGNKLYSRGDLTVLAANDAGPGVLAFKREYQGQSSIILLNTADHSILLNQLNTTLPAGSKLNTVFTTGPQSPAFIGSDGLLSMALPARTILIFETNDQQISLPPAAADVATITVNNDLEGQRVQEDIVLTGQINRPGAALKLIVNGNLDAARDFKADVDGGWQIGLPIKNLGTTKYAVEVFAPHENAISRRLQFTSDVVTPRNSPDSGGCRQ